MSTRYVQTMKFDSWGEFVDAAENLPNVSGLHSSDRDQDEAWDKDWYMSKNAAEAFKLARDGWQAGAERVRAIQRNLEVRMISRIVREDVNYDVEGMSFDVARYLDGEPEHWVVMEESTMQSDAHRHVKIVYNMAASCGVDAATLSARGATVAALCELLEFAGHKVELWLSMGAQGHKGADLEAYVRVKPYDQPLDSGRVAFALASTATFRRLGFRLIEGSEKRVAESLGSNYGMPKEAKLEDASLYIGHAMLGNVAWTSPQAAEAWALAQLAAQGVILRDE